jgi:hypothetical protein
MKFPAIKSDLCRVRISEIVSNIYDEIPNHQMKPIELKISEGIFII